MQGSLNIKTIRITYLSICFLLIVPLFVAIIIGSNSDNLIFRDLNNIGLISLALFILLTCMSVVKEKYFYIILPFMLLAFPSIINRFFPGVFFGFQGEEIIPSPIFTWLDVYLFSIISYYIFIKKKRFKATLMDNKIVFVVFVLISISYVINLLFSKSINDFLISVSTPILVISGGGFSSLMGKMSKKFGNQVLR